MEHVPPCKPKAWIGMRHKQMLIVLFGVIISHMQKYNISLALVAMGTPVADPTYPIINYTTPQKGILFSSFFYGCTIGTIPWGVISVRYDSAKLLAVVMGFLEGLISIIMPLCAIYLGFGAICVARAVEGLLFGALFPCCFMMMTKWVVPHEREQFSWVWAGMFIGQLLSYPLSGFLATTLAGWPSVFYVPGLLSIIWGLICYKYGRSSPRAHPGISKEENDYISYYQRNVTTNDFKIRVAGVPWLSIITSAPFLANVCSQGAEKWGANALNNFIPIFLHGVHNFDIQANGLLSSLPSLMAIISSFVCSYVGNKLVPYATANFRRKCWNSIGLYAPCIILVVLATIETGAASAITLLTICVGISSALQNGCMANVMDLAPNLSGFLHALMVAPTNIASILSNTFSGFIINDENNVAGYQTLFLVTAIVFFIGNTIFIIFGSAEIQSWNKMEPIKSSKSGTENKSLEMTND